jgi:MFS family permease
MPNAVQLPARSCGFAEGSSPSSKLDSSRVNTLPSIIVAALAAAATYTCMYAFRKPFTAAAFEGLVYAGVNYKVWLVVAQVLGYMASKFFGIRFISEMKPEGRLQRVMGLIGFAWLALLGFALAPAPWNIAFMFLNGLPLGLIWGIVFSYLEGRRSTELLGVVLASTFIFASGFVKSVGSWVITDCLPLWGNQSQFWMPFVTGALFVVPLAGAAWLLDRTPPPDRLDVESRSERRPMSQAERRAFLQKFLPCIVVLVAAYLLLTALRDLRDNFAAEMWAELGFGSQPAIFTKTELPATLVILGGMSLLVFVKNNHKALLFNHLSILLGMVLVLASTLLFSQKLIGAPLWAMLGGVGLYLAYVPFNCLLFERLIAAYRQPGNIGFIMYVADAVGYLGSVAVLLVKEFGQFEVRWTDFLVGANCMVAVLGVLLVGVSVGYFYKKSRIETA